MSRVVFEEVFFPTYLSIASDKVDAIRYEFAKSLLEVKPYIDGKSEINSALIKSISVLKNDKDREVAEITETTDFELLKSRKKVLAGLQQKEDACLALMKKLDEREILEAEERKKRIDDEDAYDYLGIGSKNGNLKGGIRRGVRGAGAATSSSSVNPAKGTRKISTGQVADNNSSKKKKPVGQPSSKFA